MDLYYYFPNYRTGVCWYYKQKLQLHNFTLFVLNNADITLYAWHEANISVTTNEFTRFTINYVENLPPQYKNVIHHNRTFFSGEGPYYDGSRQCPFGAGAFLQAANIFSKRLFISHANGLTQIAIHYKKCSLRLFFK